jgi:hypothetical protein
MFDQGDQNQQLQNATVTPEPVQPIADQAAAPAVSPASTPPVFPTDTPTIPAINTSADTLPNNESSASDFNATVLNSDTSTDEPASSPLISSSFDPSSVSSDPINTSLPQDTASSSKVAEPSDNNLLAIKQEALHNLSPLLSQLDQSPEEKFRTTMMLIQASDDQSLIQTAYSSAKEITDEKVRAQALLDIVNEINYFTQHKDTAATS